MKKISIFATQDGQFRHWDVFESDITQDGKSLFAALYLTPSKIRPTSEDAKRYTGIASSQKLSRAYKELEIRGVLIFAPGDGIILRDKVLPKPEAVILPLHGAEKVKAEPGDHEELRKFYMSEYMKASGGERYPWNFAKDGKAAKGLLADYGLAGAKAKIRMAFTYENASRSQQEYFRSCARDLTRLKSIATQLIQAQVDRVTDPGKWEASRGVKEMKV